MDLLYPLQIHNKTKVLQHQIHKILTRRRTCDQHNKRGDASIRCEGRQQIHNKSKYWSFRLYEYIIMKSVVGLLQCLVTKRLIQYLSSGGEVRLSGNSRLWERLNLSLTTVKLRGPVKLI